MKVDEHFINGYKKNSKSFLARRTDCMEIDNRWYIEFPANGPAAAALLDFKQFLQKSMDVVLNDYGEKKISILINPGLKNDYEMIVEEAQIIFCGGTESAAAQAVFRAEDTMTLLRGPYLKKGRFQYHPRFFPRLVSSGIAQNKYPNDYLTMILRHGYNGIVVEIQDIETQKFVPLLSQAHKRGLLVFAAPAFVYAQKENFEDLTRLGFDGFIFGRNFDFKSKDPHTSGLLRSENRNEEGEKRINKPDASQWHCLDYAEILKEIQDAIIAINPNAMVVLDTSSWNTASQQDKTALIHKLPSNTVLLISFDSNQKLIREGVRVKTYANTLVMSQASEMFLAEYTAAKERGLPVWASTAASGRTDDFGLIPYIPAMMQWLLRFDALKDLEITGTLETGKYGFFPSVISEFAKEQFTEPCQEAGISIQQLAAVHYGSENTEKMMLVFKKLSDGVNFLFSDRQDIAGPFLCGPAFPLLTEREEAFLGKNKIYDYAFWEKDITLETDILLKAAENFDKAAGILKSICEGRPKEKETAELYAVCTLLTNTLITCVNAKRWYRRRYAFVREEGFKKQFLLEQMIHIGQQEIKNAQESAEIIAEYPFLSGNILDHDLCSLEKLEEKIRLTEKSIGELKKMLC